MTTPCPFKINCADADDPIANLSAEIPDQLLNHRVGYYNAVPPIDWNWINSSCQAIADSDAKAANDARLCDWETWTNPQGLPLVPAFNDPQQNDSVLRPENTTLAPTKAEANASAASQANRAGNTKGMGACCTPDGRCLNMTEAQCAQWYGKFRAGSCSNVNCAIALCCKPDQTCVELTKAGCTAAGGTPGAFGSKCGDANCSKTVAEQTECQDVDSTILSGTEPFKVMDGKTWTLPKGKTMKVSDGVTPWNQAPPCGQAGSLLAVFKTVQVGDAISVPLDKPRQHFTITGIQPYGVQGTGEVLAPIGPNSDGIDPTSFCFNHNGTIVHGSLTGLICDAIPDPTAERLTCFAHQSAFGDFSIPFFSATATMEFPNDGSKSQSGDMLNFTVPLPDNQSLGFASSPFFDCPEAVIYGLTALTKVTGELEFGGGTLTRDYYLSTCPKKTMTVDTGSFPAGAKAAFDGQLKYRNRDFTNQDTYGYSCCGYCNEDYNANPLPAGDKDFAGCRCWFNLGTAEWWLEILCVQGGATIAAWQGTKGAGATGRGNYTSVSRILDWAAVDSIDVADGSA